jgi:copper chaperone CopZ
MRRALALSCLPLCALAFSACATKTSTGGFKGADKEVAQAVANLQSAVTAGDQKKICAEDLSASVVSSLGGTKGCEAAIKEQVAEIDGTEAEVESIQLNGKTATAKVRSTFSGRKTQTEVTLVEEGGKWKVSAVKPIEAPSPTKTTG